MKIIASRHLLGAAAIALTLFVGSHAKAADDWTKADTARQWVYTGVALADALTTADIRNHDDIEEATPLARWALGKNPEPLPTAVYFAASAGLNYAIARALPRKYRAAWQTSTIALNGYVVGRNIGLGLRVGF